MDNLQTILSLVFGIITIIGMWKVFEKANEAGWKSLIPIYNVYITLKIVGKPWWWLLLMLIPFLGIIWTFWASNLLAKSFKKDFGYTLGLVFLPFVFYPLLGFGDAHYHKLHDNSESETLDPIE